MPWLTIEEKAQKEKIGISIFVMDKESCCVCSSSFKERKTECVHDKWNIVQTTVIKLSIKPS